jgi:hypothetical protein
VTGCELLLSGIHEVVKHLCQYAAIILKVFHIENVFSFILRLLGTVPKIRQCRPDFIEI